MLCMRWKAVRKRRCRKGACESQMAVPRQGHNPSAPASRALGQAVSTAARCRVQIVMHEDQTTGRQTLSPAVGASRPHPSRCRRGCRARRTAPSSAAPARQHGRSGETVRRWPSSSVTAAGGVCGQRTQGKNGPQRGSQLPRLLAVGARMLCQDFANRRRTQTFTPWKKRSTAVHVAEFLPPK